MFFVFAKAQIQADFAATIPAVCSPVAVQFSDSSKGSPNKWVWDFGNGDTSHKQNPTEFYTKAGNYIVTLTASNSSSSNVATKTITIIGSVEAGFTYQYDNVCAAPSSFTLKANDPRDTILYAWNFGNGKSATGSATSTIFNSNGNYGVRLITKTTQGCTDTAFQTFSIGAAKAGFSSFSVVCKNAPVTFTDTSSPIPLTTTWLVNNVSAGSGSTFVHTFAPAGTFSVKMVAVFGTCTQTVEKIITVKEKPVPNFTQTGSLQSCTLPLTINFANISTNADSYKWVFGDGNTNNKISPDYTYNTAGTFSPSLIAFNGDGCSDTLTKSALLRLGPPVITSFTALPKSGCIPETITSDANITSPDPVTGYDWNTGDANIHTTNSQLNHVYNNEGYYTVSLTVTTKNGCTSAPFSLFQAVAAGTKPITDFAVDKPTVCASVPVNFIDKSVGKVTSWNYNFGDGLSATGQNPSHVFTKIGSNDVTLYTSNKGCSGDPKTIKNIVTVLPPIAGFTYSFTCANQLAVQFADKSQQPVSWQWDFGDGHSSSSQSPFYTFTSSGDYRVILKTTNGNCASSDTMNVTVTNDKPIIVIDPAKAFVCRNDSIKLSAVSSSGFVTTYAWNLGDGTPVMNDSTVTHIYKKSSDYKPYVAVQYVNKCRDTIYTTEPLHVYGPTAVFSTTQNGNCLPLAVTFTDKSTSDNLHTIDSKQWFYGNGETDVVNADVHFHTYTNGGTFLPKLIVTDAVGCIDSITGTQNIIAKGVAAGFTYTIFPTCDSSVVSFTNTSVAYNDEIASYSWSFGDGRNKTSVIANPVYAYYKKGSYKITLTITTKGGCTTDTTVMIDIAISDKPNITITVPTVACVASDITLSASISGNSSISEWKWNLGNGVNKNGQTITATYNKPGPFTIQTIVVSSDACSDTTYKDITISDVPQTNAGKDSFVCAGSSILLQASGADSYVWQQVNNELSCTNCTSPSATPSSPNSYVVTGKNAAGCVSNDTVFIDVQQKEIVTISTDKASVCEGGSIQLQASGADEYQWQPADGLSNPFIANPIASPLTSTTYSVTGTDKRHCFTSGQATAVSIEPSPQFNIIDSVITLSRGTKHVFATTSSADVVRWFWEPATGLSCSVCAQPELTATIAATYKATAYTAAGCSDSDNVNVLLLCDESGIFIPTAFTPNSDGKNDRFYPKSFADSKIVSFTIINRNGAVIFRKQNVFTNVFNDGWDGTYNGVILPADTYIYMLEVMCEKNIIPFRGTVTLIR